MMEIRKKMKLRDESGEQDILCLEETPQERPFSGSFNVSYNLSKGQLLTNVK